MKINYLIPIIGILALTIACNSNEEEIKEHRANEEKGTMVMRGKYLVSSIGCGDCHTPKYMTDHGPVWDTTRNLSGYNANNVFGEYDTTLVQSGKWTLFNEDFTAFAGPWGVSFAANLTPDPTGIGGWTLEHFKTAIRKGKYKGLENSRPLLPPMPWEVYKNLTDEDIESIYEYLRTIKPIENRVPAPIPPRA